MASLIDRVFSREEMDGDGRCATYLVRWTLLKWRGRGIYLHHFVGDDWSKDLHDHPKRFISIGLRGGYIEETPESLARETDGRWEVLVDPDGEMVRVRWSVPDAHGLFWWVRHYPATPWGMNACEGQAARFNAEGRSPYEWTDYRPARGVDERVFSAPWVRTFPAEHIHRIRLIDGRPCWTIVIVLRTERPWGFWHAGAWIPWRQYVNSDTATQMKSCP